MMKPNPKTSKKRFFLHLGIWLIFLLVLWVTFNKLLDVYVSLGEETNVPRITQLPFQAALDSLSAHGLTYHIQDTQSSTLLPTGYVLFQYPAPGTRTKKRTTVALVISAFNAQRNYLPDIEGELLRTAGFKLNELNIKIKDTIWVDSVLFLRICNVYLNGEKLDPGAIIRPSEGVTLYVGSKKEKQITVPNLVGLSETEALIFLHGYELSLGKVYRGDNTQTRFGVINKQSPAPYDEFGNQNVLVPGSAIDVWVE